MRFVHETREDDSWCRFTFAWDFTYFDSTRSTPNVVEGF